MNEGHTERGFRFFEFKDRYEQNCSLQESSSAMEPCIWLGVSNTGDQIRGPGGQYNEDINARMHISQRQMQELLPMLEHFAKTGVLP